LRLLTLVVQVVTVQKYFRRMLAKCHADNLRLRARCLQDREQMRSVMKGVESTRRLERDFKRRLNPRTKDDFELLYNAMEGECGAFASLHFIIIVSLFSANHITMKKDDRTTPEGCRSAQ